MITSDDVPLTVADIDQRRRTPEEITDLARDVVTRRKMVTNKPQVIENAFSLVFAVITIEAAAAQRIGALVGDYGEVVPRMGRNGYPLFLSVGFVHIDDVPALQAELDRMYAALGVPSA